MLGSGRRHVAVGARYTDCMIGAGPVRLFPRPILWTGILVGLAVAACATTSGTSLSPGELESLMRASGVADPIVPYEPSPEMVAWAKRQVPPTVEDSRRLEILADRLLSERGKGMRYRRDATVTAIEAFAGGEANCLAFTHLFVGLARSLGVSVRFLEIRDLERYDKADDLIVHSDHIAVGYGPRHQMLIIDFAAEQGLQYREIAELSDLEATAMYYSNRGAEALQRGEMDEALSWLGDAVRFAPDLAAPWVNYGVARRRSGDFEAAESAYRRALELDVAEFSAYQNLAALLRMTGRADEAYDLLTVTDAAKNRNPYTFLALGDLSARNGRLEDAERFYRRAIRVQRDDAEVLAAMGNLALKQQDLAAAKRWLRKARRIDPDQERVRDLESGLRILSVPDEAPRPDPDGEPGR